MHSVHDPIHAAFLSHCNSTEAYHWLRSKNEVLTAYEKNSPVLEYILLRRNSKIIDLGLAQYGTSAFVVSRVFRRGSLGTRCAALRNGTLGYWLSFNYGWLMLSEIRHIVDTSKRELYALASNPFLNDEAYADLMRRSGPFSEHYDNQYFCILDLLADNPRFDPVKEKGYIDIYDGLDRAIEGQLRAIPWEIANIIKPTQAAARALQRLIEKVGPPVNYNGDIYELLNRWQIDSESGSRNHPPSYYIRSFLADAAMPDKALLSSRDAAQRASFYARFTPKSFSNWDDIVASEPDAFVFFRLCRNKNLWKDFQLRERLFQVCRNWRGDGDSFEALNEVNAAEDHFSKAHPEWFQESSESELSRIRDYLAGYLAKINQTIKDIPVVSENVAKLVAGETYKQSEVRIYVKGIKESTKHLKSNLDRTEEKVNDMSHSLKCFSDSVGYKFKLHWFLMIGTSIGVAFVFILLLILISKIS